MVTEELLRYVEYQSNRSVDRNSIKMTLLQNGWSGDDITEAFKIVDTVATADAQLANQANYSNDDQTASQNFAQIARSQSATANNQLNRTDSIQNQNSSTQNSSNVQSGSSPITNVLPENNLNQINNDQSQSNVNNNEFGQLNSIDDNQNTNQVEPSGVMQNQSATVSASGNMPGSAQSVGQQTNQVNNLSTGQSIDQSREVSDQPELNALKYRTAGDWQNNRPVNQGQSADSSMNNSDSTGPGVYMQSTSGQIISSNQSFDSALHQSTGAAQPNTDANTNQTQVAASPKTALQLDKSKKTGGGKKAILIILILIVLGALGFAGYYFYDQQNSVPAYQINDIVDALSSQDYIIFTADAALPIAIESINNDSPPAIQRLDQPSVSFSSQGLVSPILSKVGFEVVVGKAKFDYVYDGSDSYGRIRELPQDLRTSFESSINKWFNFTDPNDTRVVQQFFTNNPNTSMTDTGIALSDAISSLYSDGNIDFNFSESYKAQSGTVDTFNFSLDTRQILSRLESDASLISSIISYLNISTLQGSVKIERESKLPQSLRVDLSPESTLVISFNYDYNDQGIMAPAQTNPVSEVVLPLQSLSEVSAVNKIRSSLRTVGSNASVYFNENQSYAGFCDTEAIQMTIASITEFSGILPFCNSISAGFAFQAKLPIGDHFACIDNDLLDQATLTPLGQATACGQAVQYPEPEVVAPDSTASIGSEIQASTDSQAGLNMDPITGDQFFE